MTSTATIQIDSDAPVDAVWTVLSDGWSYASWVVGASRVRAVDPEWPQTGSRLHHSFGPWPLVINDHTEVLECIPEQFLRLKARGWPTGEAHVTITTTAKGSGSTISIEEDATSGPAVIVPKAIRQMLMVPRNREALRRLKLLAEGRARGD